MFKENTSKVGAKKSRCAQHRKVGVHFSGKVGVHRKLGVILPELSIYIEDLKQKLRRFFLVFSVMENSGTVLRDFYKHEKHRILPRLITKGSGFSAQPIIDYRIACEL